MSRASSTYSSYMKTLQSVSQLYESGKKDEAQTMFLSDAETERKQLLGIIRDLTGVYEKKSTDSLAASERKYWNTLTLMGGVVGLIVLSAAAIAWWVFRGVTGSLEQVAATLRRVSRSDTSELPRIDIATQDEVGDIAAAFNQMAAALERQASKEAEYQQVLREQAEHKSTVADIFASYQGVQDLRTLAELFTSAVTPLLGASYAAFYAETDAEQQTTCLLFKIASYAADGEVAGKESVARGEGLVGQCALERKMLLLHNVPADYVRIGSGLGSATPLHLLLVPVSYEGRAIAVLEFASFEPFGAPQLALLEEVTGLLGITVKSAHAHSQIQRLLHESQTFAEELQTQSEELQLQQEELRVLNEQLEAQYKDTDRRNRELEHMKKELENKNEQVMLTSQYKTEFLANVSHELRTPLNSLLLLAHLLADNSEGNLHPRQIEYLRTIHSAGTDLHNLINDILDMSKMESGKMELVADSISVRELASSLEQQFAPLAAQKGLRFETQMDDKSSGLTVCTDVYKAQQILKNLLSNAIKFTEEGVVTIAFRGETDGIAVAVSDTGIGIPANKQEMVFEAFRQADGTTSRKFGGTGLGLFISQEIADLLGGRITLHSKEGAGSTFTLWLPLTMPEKAVALPAYSEVAAAALPSASAAAAEDDEAQMGLEQRIEMAGAELKGKKVLLVDDDMRNIFALTGVLESFGMHVVFAENGQEGLDMLASHPDTDLILMDIMMPVMDGYEAIRAIRRSELPHRQLPIVALTAKAMKHDREKCIEAGASDYISKPIQTEQLVSLLRVWLHR
jgi:two-component system chemotaxis sensor kinase CheA